MQAIKIRFLGPRHAEGKRFTVGPRFKASCQRGYHIMEYDNDIGIQENVVKVTNQLLYKFCSKDKKKYGQEFEQNPWARVYSVGSIDSDTWIAVFENEEHCVLWNEKLNVC